MLANADAESQADDQPLESSIRLKILDVQREVCEGLACVQGNACHGRANGGINPSLSVVICLMCACVASSIERMVTQIEIHIQQTSQCLLLMYTDLRTDLHTDLYTDLYTDHRLVTELKQPPTRQRGMKCFDSMPGPHSSQVLTGRSTIITEAKKQEKHKRNNDRKAKVEVLQTLKC